jgi:hypothetical protein
MEVVYNLAQGATTFLVAKTLSRFIRRIHIGKKLFVVDFTPSCFYSPN